MGLLFLSHIRLMLIVDEIYDRCPAIPVIHIVAEPRCIDDGQLQYTISASVSSNTSRLESPWGKRGQGELTAGSP